MPRIVLIEATQLLAAAGSIGRSYRKELAPGFDLEGVDDVEAGMVMDKGE
jgi:hypothetical protein